jgi:asparagine synthase (glutamine-hydrolysing)
MCGISGILNSWRDLDDKTVKALQRHIGHRGPDDEGIYVDETVTLIHSRLSIVDLSANGHQPMHSTDGRYVLIFNGEIYNHQEIRATLIPKGYIFKGTSDTETLLYAYAAYGKEVLQMLNGIFAFAILDRLQQTLFIARDQFGVKPLYYYHKGSQFAFSSELKSFTALPHFDKTIDHTALVNYINYLWSPGEQTPFQYVKKLKQGHFIELTPDKNFSEINPVKYYQIPFNGIYSKLNASSLITTLDEKFQDAVRRQLMSDVPVGFFLSGGVDSSIVAAIAQKMQLTDKPLECYTINTGSNHIKSEGFSNDLTYARLLAKKLGFKLNEISGEIDIINEFDKMIWHLDEPQADPAPLNVLNICRAARADGIKVMLGGAAGDDLFSGYRRHLALNYEKYFESTPEGVSSLFLKISNRLNASHPFNRRLKKLLHQTRKSKYDRLAGYYSWLPANQTLALFSEESKLKMGFYFSNSYLFDLLSDIPNEHSDLNKMLYWELNSFLPDHNLNYTDKMSMAAGVEVRVPFLDRELVEFSTTIPPHLKMKGNTTKYILKKVSEKYLPKEIIYRSKAGFGAPIRKWIMYDLDELIHERLSPDKIKSRGIFDTTAVWKLIDDNKKGRIDASYTIWSLLAIESWMQQFNDIT